MRLASLLFVVCLAASCSAKNPNFCEGDQCSAVDAPIDSPPVTCTTNGPDPSCPAGNPICVSGACTGLCDADTDCDNRPATESVCHAGSGACVACDEDDAQADPAGGAEDDCVDPGMAVCDGTSHTCRACAAHAECTSGICDAGRCAEVGQVVYVDTAGADGNDCGLRATPCLTLNEAIDKVQAMPAVLKYIFMAPSATTYGARNGNGTADFNDVEVYVLAIGAAVERNGDGLVVDVHGGADVTIEGLTVKNANGAAGDGISCGTTSTLTLLGAIITNNDALGLNASSCSLTMYRSQVVNNSGGGVTVTGDYQIVNNVIAGNGNSITATFGGVSLSSGANTNKFEFNTVALNNSQAGAPDGINCTNNGLNARNNIVIGAAGKQHVNLGTNCNHTNTLFTPDNMPAGAGNVLVTDQTMYMFSSNTDFHLRQGSVAAGKAQSSGLTGESLFDLDGDARTPDSLSLDVGADEIP